MYTQVLLISSNSRSHRVYHDLAKNIQCQLISLKTVGDGLAHMLICPPQILVLDDSLPVFEVMMFLEVIAKKPQWNMPILALGFAERKNLFPKATQFANNHNDFVRLLQGLCDMVKKHVHSIHKSTSKT